MLVLLAITVASLCLAGMHRGEGRLLQRLDNILTEARVIEAKNGPHSGQRQRRQDPDPEHYRRQAASKLNKMESVELVPIPEEARPMVKPPTPTRTYSLRYMQPRMSLARKMSAALGGMPLIDLNTEAPPPLPELTDPLKPEEQGEWV